MHMHTEKNTNIDNIIRNCQERNLADEDNNCVLIITGSLNPIHSSHIKNLQLVQSYLEHHKTRPLNVLAAYLSPTHDSYVRNKLGTDDWIPAIHRSELCDKVIESEHLQMLVSVAKGEFSYSRFVDFDEVTINLAKFLNNEHNKLRQILKYPLKVVYVCGLDHFNKCSHVEHLAKEENIACAVIYRLSAPDNRIKCLEENSSNIYYITLEDERKTLVDISSTAIRKRYRNGNDTSEDHMTYPAVEEFLKRKYHKI